MNLMKSMMAVIIIVLNVTIIQADEVFKTEVSDTQSVAFSDDAKLVAYGCYKKIYIIDAKTKQTIQILEGATGDITDLAFVGNRLMATGGKYLGIWDTKTKNIIKIIERKEYTYRFSICRQTKTVYIGGIFIEAFDIQTGKSVMKTKNFKNKMESFAVSPDGKKLFVSPEWGNSILVLNAKTGKQIKELKEVSRARQMLFSPDGKSLFIKQFGKPIKQIDLEGKVLQEIEVRCTLDQFALSNNGEYLLIPTWSTQRKIEQVLIYDIKKKKMITPINVSEKSIYEVKISFDSNMIVVAPKDNLLHFFSFKK